MRGLSPCALLCLCLRVSGSSGPLVGILGSSQLQWGRHMPSPATALLLVPTHPCGLDCDIAAASLGDPVTNPES